jgi:hypothetical protein
VAFSGVRSGRRRESYLTFPSDGSWKSHLNCQIVFCYVGLPVLQHLYLADVKHNASSCRSRPFLLPLPVSMPLFHSKFTRKLASTVDLLQWGQTDPDGGGDRPIQYIAGDSIHMCRERKPSIASAFINSAITMIHPNLEKSKEFLRKLAKMHPPGEAKTKSILKESIVIVRNPENDRMLSFCDMDEFGGKALTRFQLDAVHEYDENRYIRSVGRYYQCCGLLESEVYETESLHPPAPMLPYGHKNHRFLRAVASVSSIDSRTSSFQGINEDSPPIGTLCDSFKAQQEMAIMQATHSRTPSNRTNESIKSLHNAKSIPLLNRPVNRSHRPPRLSRE